MFGNELRTKLLEQRRAENLFDEGVRDRDWNHKMIHKTYADNRRGVAKNPVMAGDVALMKNTKTFGKLHANFQSEPYTVPTKEGSQVTVWSKEDVEERRNSFFDKRLN